MAPVPYVPESVAFWIEHYRNILRLNNPYHLGGGSQELKPNSHQIKKSTEAKLEGKYRPYETYNNMHIESISFINGIPSFVKRYGLDDELEMSRCIKIRTPDIFDKKC